MNNLKLAEDLISSICEKGFAERQGEDSGKLSVCDPATGRVVAVIPLCQGIEITDKFDSAAVAQIEWSALLPDERSSVLLRWANLIEQQKESLAALLSLEQGKPIGESALEIAATIDNVRWSAQEVLKIENVNLKPHLPEAQNVIIYQPVGVVAAITPWNFPSAMVTRKAAPALAAGCAVVLKPAEDTPLSAMALVHLAWEAGVPNGAFSYVILDRDSAPLFSDVAFSHPAVRMASFTGSTAVGKKLVMQSAKNVVKLSLELGGNAPFIIGKQADLEKAIEGAFASKFRNAGQTCICANRIFVHEDVYDSFLTGLLKRIASAKVGNAFADGVEIGPVINKQAYERLAAYADSLLSDGAKEVEIQGESSNDDLDIKGYFVQPRLFECVKGCVLLKQEIFGPIAALVKYGDSDDVAQMANDTEYGLAAYIYDENKQRAERLAALLQYGMVGINETRIAHASIPFGGVKQSGIGREGGPESPKNFMNIKYICKT